VTPCPPDIQEKIKSIAGESVSRETFLKLETYLSFLEKENKKYNLVGPGEIDRLWDRHVLDSAQLLPFVKQGSLGFLDVGSGAGFPGVVLSLLGAQGGCLVEASRKKCSFLENVSRETGAEFSVLNVRVEELRGRAFEKIVSRALAPIGTSLGWTQKICSPATQWIFLKGKTVDVEIEEARKSFSFDVEMYPSLTNPEGRIVRLQNIFF